MSIELLIKNFDILQAEGPSVFMLRHAEKPSACSMDADITNSITVEGVKSSKKLGSILYNLYPQIGIVRSSPIKRCLETANNIFSQYPTEVPIIHDTKLGGSGAYVSDDQLAAQHFTNNPGQKDIFVQMQNGKKFAGMREIKAGTKLLLKNILRDLENFTNPNFHITHDCILALFTGTLIGKIVNEKNWFQYLDGICIKRAGNKINLYWQNEIFDISKKLELL